MKTVVRRLLILEERHAARRNKVGLTAAEVGRERICRWRAAETGRPYEEVLREHEEKSRQCWKNYGCDTTSGASQSMLGRMPRLQSRDEAFWKNYDGEGD